MEQNVVNVNAAAAALEAHSKAMGGVDGDPSVQLWHLLASLSEWAAVNNVNLHDELMQFNEALGSNDLNLPAAEGALKAKREADSIRHSRQRHHDICVTAAKVLRGDVNAIRYKTTVDSALDRCLSAASSFQSQPD